MKTHSEEYKKEISLLGKQQSVLIEYNNTTLTNEDLNNINFYYQSRLLKSAMKGVNIDSNINIPKGTEFVLKHGLLVNGEYEYLTLGTFIVKDNQKQEDTESYLLECYDRLLPSMVDYKRLNITYPITVRNYIKAICEHLGLQFKNAEDEFPNYDKLIKNELYLDIDGNSLGYTFRDVLDELSQVTAGVICIDEESGQVEIRTIKETGDEIDEDYFRDVNVNFGEKFGPINSIVLSRADADNIFKQDEVSVALNGLCEVKIIDNQIMNWDDRDTYLPDILEALNGIEYYINDFSSTGIVYYDLLDRYTARIGEKTYSCVMFNDEINIDQGLEELIYTEMPEESETDYKSADKTDRKINQTIFRVNKQEQKIGSLITQVGDRTGKETSLTQDVDSIKTNVGFVADLTQKVSGINPITLSKCLAGELQELRIQANNSIFNPLYPSSNLYPSSTLYPRGKTYLKIIHQEIDENDVIIETTKTIDLNLSSALRMYNAEIYDEFVYQAVVPEGESKGKVIRRVGILEDGTLYPLSEERIEFVEIEDLLLGAGTNIITFNEGHYGLISAIYIQESTFTKIFATTYEVNSFITQLSNSIDLLVKEKVGKDEVIADLNIAIKDGQGVIEFIANTISWKSDNSELTPEGKIYLTAGVIAGMTMSQTNKNSYLFKNYTNSENEKLQSGLYIPEKTDGSVPFLYAGCPVDGVLEDSNMYIRHDGLMKAKWFDVNGESGYFNINYDSKRRALNLHKDWIAWYIDNDENNLFFSLTRESTFMNMQLYDATDLSIYDGVHSTYMVEFVKYDPNSSNTQKLGHYTTFYGRIFVEGQRMDGVNNSIYIQGYEVQTTASDERIKKNILDSEIKALELINKIHHKSFDWDKEKANKEGHVDIGYIAQELIEIDPNFVIYNKEFDTYQINTLYVLSTATKAIQELDKKLEKRDKIIEFLAEKLNCKDEVLEMLKEGE